MAGHGIALLDALKHSDDIWLARADEGRLLAQQLSTSPASIVVLYGPPRSGKTTLLNRWLMPTLAASWRLVYRAGWNPAAAPLPGDLPVLTIWDGFEACLAAPDLERGVLETLTSASRDPRNKLVLVVQDTYLGRVFQLRGAVHHIVDEVIEIPAMGGAGWAQMLTAVCRSQGVVVTTSFLTGLSADVEAIRHRFPPGPDLVALLAFEVCRFRTMGGEVSIDDYGELGGLVGMLERHLDYVLEYLPGGTDVSLAWSVLRQLTSTAGGPSGDFAELAARFDVPVDTPQATLAWLRDERQLVVETAGGGHDFAPPELALAVDVHSRREREATEYPRWILRQGARHQAEADSLLSETSFQKVHAQRTALVVSDDEAALMLRCALAYGDASNAVDYWLRRITSASRQAEVLLDALFDSRQDMRLRAVSRLGAFPAPEVRGPLHLAALRDASAEVRAAAVRALEPMKDDELRAALTQEITDPNSRYRIAAIEALRIFDDRETVETLRDVILRHAPHHDLAARSAAIRVLGQQRDAASVHALVDVALHDPDGDDRQAAVGALNRVSSPAAADAALRLLRDRRRRTWNARAGSWASAGRALLGILTATVATAINCPVSGFLLATLRRWRLAAVLTIPWGLVLAGGLNGKAGRLVVFLWLGATIVGFTAAAHVLLNQRLAGARQSWYARWLTVVVFAFGCVTGFLAAHGLAPWLVGQRKRARTLFAFEIGALFLVMSADWLFGSLALGVDAASDRVALWSAKGLGWAGWTMFVATWLIGIASAAREVFWRDRREVVARIDTIRRGLIENEAAQSVVVAALLGPDPQDARWARRVLDRAGGRLDKALTRRWSEAGPDDRQRIFASMVRTPTRASLRFLTSAAAALGFGARVRYAWARTRLALSALPAAVLMLLFLGASVSVLYVAALFEFARSHPVWLLNRATTRTALEAIPRVGGAIDERRQEAIRTLGKLARSQQPVVSALATTSLQLALGDPALLRDPALLAQTLDNIPPRPTGTPIEDSIVRLLNRRQRPQPASSDAPKIDLHAVNALERIGTPEAVERLRWIAEGRTSPPTEAPTEVDISPAARVEAVDALGRIETAGAAPLQALIRLRQNEGLQLPLQKAVANAVGRIDALRRADLYIESGQRAFDTGQHERALAYLDAALLTGAQLRRLGSVIDLGLRLSFYYHERASTATANRAARHAAFERAYGILRDIQSVSNQTPHDRQALMVDGNLAETLLTTGRTDAALRQARDVIARASKFPASESLTLNMMFFVAAALTVKGDAEASTAALSELYTYHDSLEAGFTNTWTYAGTLAYIDASPLSEIDKFKLRTAIKLVAPSS